MEDNDRDHTKSLNRVIEVGTRLAVILFILGWCYLILEPFFTLIIWGVIIAVAVSPTHQRIRKWLKGRSGWAATIVVLILFLILLIPTIFLTESLIEGIAKIRSVYQHGDLVIPAPGDRVASWPAIAKPIVDVWTLASQNLQGAIAQYQDELKDIAGKLLKLVAGTGLGILQMLLSVIIAGVLLKYSDAGTTLMQRIFHRLAGEKGDHFLTLSQQTIRSVVKGILGVAFIQSLMAGVGFVMVGIPVAGLWTLFCLVLAMMQIGVGPIVIPSVIYVFSTSDTGVAIVYLIWSVIILISDNILKPFLLGRGVSVPMLVVFLGSIGGFLARGLVGLFLGPVVLSIGFVMFQMWSARPETTESTKSEETTSPQS